MPLKHQHRRHRTSSTCHRHPTSKPTTGFCPSCLRERLATIESQSPSSSASAITTPHLRRTKSYSSRANQNPSDVVEQQPRRRSCDVRPNSSTLHDLFFQDENVERRSTKILDLGLELREEDEEEDEEEEEKNGREEIEGFDDFEEGGGEWKPMKEFIDLECGRNKEAKKNNGIALVLTKKLMKWGLKQKGRKGGGANDEFVDKGKLVEETTKRRSCDVDPTLSLDAGRISFEEPRASWDGCLVGKNYPKLMPLASVNEEVKGSMACDNDEEEKNPGGSAQTRDYYADSKRRRSFDRSSSIKRGGLLEVDEVKAVSNTKVSPETLGLFHGAKLLVTEKELRDSNWYSIKNCKPESLEYGAKGVGGIPNEVTQEGFVGLKKPRMKWPKGWNIWGLMQRRSETKNGVKEGKSLKLEADVIEGSLAESLLKLRRVAKGEANGAVSQKLIRSYSVSARKSCDGVFHGINGVEGGRSSCDGLFHGVNGVEGGRSSCDGLFHGLKGVEAGRSSCDGLFHDVLNGIEGKGNGEKSKESHFLRQDTNTGRYSPGNLENGLLRFYLTPLRSHKTGKSGKSRLMNSSSITGSAM